MLTKKTVAVNMNLSPLIIEKSLENLIYINILNVENTKIHGLDNKQIILKMNFRDLDEFKKQNSLHWPEFIKNFVSN